MSSDAALSRSEIEGFWESWLDINREAERIFGRAPISERADARTAQAGGWPADGGTPLHGADIVVPDLRGGYSHVIAALTAEGESTVRNIGIISRGYEKFLSKLQLLGADFDIVG